MEQTSRITSKLRQQLHANHQMQKREQNSHLRLTLIQDFPSSRNIRLQQQLSRGRGHNLYYQTCELPLFLHFVLEHAAKHFPCSLGPTNVEIDLNGQIVSNLSLISASPSGEAIPQFSITGTAKQVQQNQQDNEPIICS